MKSEYQQTRFLVPDLDRAPSTFGIVTACNPEGVTITDQQNRERTERLQKQLTAAGYTFFPVTGCSHDLKHQEPGFGIVGHERQAIVDLGREWQQEAVFWVEEGNAYLLPCGNGEAVALGTWQSLVFS